MLHRLRRIANRALEPIGLKIIDAHRDQLHYQHDYADGGYEAYRDAQVAANKLKFNRIWADDRTLEVVAEDLKRRGLRDGICHGARNGFEVEWFRKRLGGEVIGTDISDTAATIPHMVVQDYHEPRAEWLNKWQFVYTNSLDQAFDPARAIATWSEQITDQGCIYIEHTVHHSAAGASEMDPFGAHPLIVPYLLFKWGRGKYCLADILELDDVAQKGRVWIFVLKRQATGSGEPKSASS